MAFSLPRCPGSRSENQSHSLLLISTGIENKLAYTNSYRNKIRFFFFMLNPLMSENRRPLGSFRRLMWYSRKQYGCLVLIYSHFVAKTYLCGFKLHNLLIRICILISLSVWLIWMNIALKYTQIKALIAAAKHQLY